jgi:hypothetical protein
MDRDDFIITVYCLVCDHYQAIVGQQRLRRRGFAPALSDEEVITIEICGEYLHQHQDEALYDYFQAHYQHFFPHLRERTGFVRQAANLWQVKQLIQHRLTVVSGQAADPIQAIDTLPLPVCAWTRGRGDRCFKPEADFSYCAAKHLAYYGFKLGLRVSRAGMILDFPLLPARPHDSQLLDDLLGNHEGIVAADKGFLNTYRQQELARKRHVWLLTPAFKQMKQQPPPAQRQLAERWRKRIEVVAAHLTERFHIAQIRTRDLWHLQHRLIRKVLAHTVCVFINLQLGRPPLQLDDLVSP